MKYCTARVLRGGLGSNRRPFSGRRYTEANEDDSSPEVGYDELALRYFRSALFVDLADLHHNAADGLHIASAGGVWSALVYGFGGFRDHRGRYTFDPRLPDGWPGRTFRLTLRGSRVRVTVQPDHIRFALEKGCPMELSVRDTAVVVTNDDEVCIALDGQGPRVVGTPSMQDVEGARRSDGTLLTASIPAISVDGELK